MRTVSARALDGREGGKPAVLVLDEEVPFPPYTGKKIRTLNLLTHLAREFSIDLIVHANQAFDESLAELSRRQITVLVAESKVPPKRGLVFPLRIATNLFSTLPYSVASHYLRGYKEAVRRQTSTKRYCLVHCEWTPYVRYLANDSIPRVVATHNIEFQIWNRLAESETFPAIRTYLKLQARRMMKFERNVFSSSPYLTAVSENDAGVIRGLGGKHVEVVPNGVDTTYFQIWPGQETEPRSLVVTGSMDWRANQEAILWFARSVHPLLKKYGNYRMYVVGRDPPSWMTTPGRLPNEMTVTGTVDDVRPYIARAAVYVVPLRSGGGSRLKILEALSMGKPVVSTPVGAEGLDLTDGRHIVLADRPEEFVRAIVSLFGDQAKCLALGKEGRQLVVARHDWLGIAHLQAAFWQKAMTELSRQ